MPLAPHRESVIRQISAALRRSSVCILAAIVGVADGFSDDTWKPIGPDLATAFAYALDPFDPERIMIGTFFNGVYLSENGGTSWKSIAPEFSSAFVQDLVADPTNEGVFYSATFERGIYKTTDGGASWSPTSDGLPVLSVRGLSMSPVDPELLLSCSFAGPFFSVDGGDYWLPSETDNLPCISAVHSRSFSSVVYLGTDGQGVFQSIDGGVNWEPWNAGMESAVVFDLVLDPLVSEVLYAATDKGVFTRGASDESWSSIKYNLPDANVDQLVFHSDGRLLASSGVGVFSYNRADPENWYLWNERPARFVIPFPETPGKFILAGFEDTLDMTLDDGATLVSSVEGVQNNFPDALATLVYQGDAVVLAGLDSGVWRSNESVSPDTRIWTQSDSIKEHLIFELAPHPSREGHVYAGTERAGVWFSEDAGLTWQQRSEGIYPRVIHDLAQSGFGEQTIYCATEVGIFISKDDGRSWKMGTNVAVPSLITAVDADPVKQGFAYYGTAAGNIFFTSNDRDFQPGPVLESGTKAIRSVPFEGIYAVTFDGSVYSSRNDTLQLEPRKEGLEHPVLDLQYDPERTEVAYAGTAGGGVYKTVSEGSLWTPSNAGIESEYIFSLALDPGDNDRIYAASQGAIFRSEDRGVTWQRFALGLPPSRNIGRILASPDEAGLVFCSVENQGVYQSSDFGESWTSLGLDPSESLGNLPILLSKTQAGELFVGSRALGVQRWEATDETWSRSASGITDLVRGIAIGRSDPDLMYAATLNSGIFRSEDSGLNWTQDGLENYRLLHVEMNPQNDAEVFAGTTIGPAVTRDDGASWKLLGQRVAYAQSLAVFDDTAGTIAVGGASGLLFFSEDKGESWESAHPSLPSNEISVMRPVGNARVFAGVDSAGLYTAEHPSLPWRLISDSLFAQDKIVAIEADPIYEQVFVAALLSGLYLTNFNGESWQQLPLPQADYANSPITSLSRDPLQPNRLYVSRANPDQNTPSIHVSEDRGATWTSAGAPQGLPGGNAHWIAPSPLVEDFALCGTDDGVYRSTNAGREWDSTSLRGVTVDRIAFDPNEKNTVYAASLGIALFISRDRGLSWAPVNWDPALLVSRVEPGRTSGSLVVSTYENGVYFTDDYGESWSGGVTPELSRATVSFVAVDPVNPSAVYFATSQQGVLRSLDGGRSFEQINNGLEPHLTALTLLVDPRDPYVIYAGTTTNGVFVSNDRGENWTALRSGMPHELTISIAANPLNSRTLYVGVEGGGVYKIEREAKLLDTLIDHDLDGISTIWEQYLNLDPLVSNDERWRQFSLPTISVNENGIAYQWFQGAGTPPQSVTSSLQWSQDLLEWKDVDPAAIKLETRTIDGNFQLQELTFEQPEPTASKSLFLRLQLKHD